MCVWKVSPVSHLRIRSPLLSPTTVHISSHIDKFTVLLLLILFKWPREYTNRSLFDDFFMLIVELSVCSSTWSRCRNNIYATALFVTKISKTTPLLDNIVGFSATTSQRDKCDCLIPRTTSSKSSGILRNSAQFCPLDIWRTADRKNSKSKLTTFMQIFTVRTRGRPDSGRWYGSSRYELLPAK